MRVIPPTASAGGGYAADSVACPTSPAPPWSGRTGDCAAPAGFPISAFPSGTVLEGLQGPHPPAALHRPNIFSSHLDLPVGSRGRRLILRPCAERPRQRRGNVCPYEPNYSTARRRIAGAYRFGACISFVGSAVRPHYGARTPPTSMNIRQWSLGPHSVSSFSALARISLCSPLEANTWSSWAEAPAGVFDGLW